MFKIKKFFYWVLCNRLSGGIIKTIFGDKIPDIRWKGYRFDVAGSGMRNSIVASIFWGFYEGAEIRFIEKYFKGDTDVVELGASSGIISAHILSKMQQPQRLISVEANRRLAGVWKINTQRHNPRNAGVNLLNKAVHYDGDSVLFAISDNTTESRALTGNEEAANTQAIPAVKLITLVNDYRLDGYSLFCDIEGAEIAVLLEDKAALQKCRHIFVELHNTSYQHQLYTAGAMKNMIETAGFDLIDSYGHVYFFQKRNNFGTVLKSL